MSSLNLFFMILKSHSSSYLVEFNIDVESNICGAVPELTDQFDDWIAAILRGDEFSDARIAKVNFNSSRQIIK